jgi:hypothetical protein
MPYEEFIGWIQFFKQRPIGWREDNRTSMLLTSQGVKKKPHELFPSLDALRRQSSGGSSKINPNLLKMLMNAKGGDEWSPNLEDIDNA